MLFLTHSYTPGAFNTSLYHTAGALRTNEATLRYKYLKDKNTKKGKVLYANII